PCRYSTGAAWTHRARKVQSPGPPAPDRKEPAMQDPQSITTGTGNQPVDGNGITTQVPPGAPPGRSPAGYRTPPDPTNPGWPAGVPYMSGNEFCERFSYYGMRAILYTHLLSLSLRQAAEAEAKASATATIHLFMAGVYALPMIGALIADRWAGKYRTIL